GSVQILLYVPGSPSRAGPSTRAVSAWLFSVAATSSAVRSSLSAYRAGRSSGVIVFPFHTPFKSGTPHGVRGTALAVGAAAAVVAAVGCWLLLPCALATNTRAATPTTIPADRRNRCLICPPATARTIERPVTRAREPVLTRRSACR